MTYSWFHDPAQLRMKAAVFDDLAENCPDEGISYAWASKARAMRSRANAIERLEPQSDQEGL